MVRTMRILTLAVLLAVVCGTTAFANGFNLNGTGSKAIGMGGAFIGLADDPSAVFWNPAGLSQTEKTTLYLFETNLIPSGTYVWKNDPLKVNVDAKTQSKIYPAGAFAFLKPVGKKLVVGATVYVPAGTGATWNGADFATFPGVGGITYTWESYMAVITGAAVASYKINDKLSLGATLNFNRGMLKMKRPALGQYEEDLTASALGATFGLLAKPHEKLSIGLTFRTPSDLNFKGDTTMGAVGEAKYKPLFAALGLSDVPALTQGERSATWPMWVGAGVALKATEKLTFTADAQYTNWKKVGVIPMTFSATSWETIKNPPAALLAHPVYGPSVRSLAMAFDQKFALNWQDAVQYRVGVQYVAGKDLALRAGYYSDPSPSPVETLNVLLPERTYNAATVGVGKKLGKLSLDFCMEALFGKDGRTPEAGFPTTVKMPGTHGMRILVPNFAVSYVF
jgi:long-chain fatty acid transport protein